MSKIKSNEYYLDRLVSIGKTKTVTKGKKIFASLIRYFMLISIGYIILYPLFYMITSSFSSKESFLDPTVVWIPKQLTLDNLKFMWDVLDYGNTFWNTVSVQIVSALIQVLSCAIAAYGFARFKFPLKKVLTAVLFITILIPSNMITVPLMVNFSKLDFLGILGLFDKITGIDIRPDVLGTAWTFYLPSLFANGLKSGILIYIYIQFFKGLPYELEEAAWIDGATPLRTFFAIAVPSSSVVILTVTVFSIIWHWNDYFMSSMFMDTDYPLAVAMSRLVELLQEHNVFLTPQRAEGLAYLLGGCLLFIIPPLVFYLIIQHWFVESVDRVGITG